MMPSKPGKPWCMRPDLHDKVSRLLDTDNLSFIFHHADEVQSIIKEYDSNIMGRFICQNKACSSTGWGSKKIAISIRLYPEKQYNARVYRQRCKQCERLGRVVLDENSYAERIAYRLRKWSGMLVDAPYYSGYSKGPHQSDLCEGCKVGHCSESL